MTWVAVSGIAEIVGAAGVIASLLYVGIQIRQNTLATQRANARLTVSDTAKALLGIQDEKVSEIVLRGIDDLESLTPHERYRFDIGITVWLEAVEQAFADYQHKDYPEDLIKPYRNRVAGVLNTPGGREWWQQRNEWFGEGFRKEVDSLLANPPKGYERAGIKPST